MNDWKTEKAMLLQKNELLGLQIQELKEREDNYKKFNDTILEAYNSLQTDVNVQKSKVYKDIQSTLEQYYKELIESKNKSTTQLASLEQENRDLKDLCSQQESKIQQLQKKCQMMELEKNDRYSFVEERHNKENIQQENNTGCIVKVKCNSKKRSKTQLNQKPDLSISKVLNCKNSNVMEVNTDFLDSQQSPNSMLQNQKKESDRSESTSPKYTNRQSLAIQLKQLTKDLKQTKELEISSQDSSSVHQLKHEIKYMINKLLKAKGQMAESIITRKSEFSNYNNNRSLADFTRQLNAVKSIENFQMVSRIMNNSYYRNF